MARSSAGGGRGGGRGGGGRGGGRGSGRGSTDTTGRLQSDARHHTSMPSFDEISGDDYESFVHVDTTRRGVASCDTLISNGSDYVCLTRKHLLV